MKQAERDKEAERGKDGKAQREREIFIVTDYFYATLFCALERSLHSCPMWLWMSDSLTVAFYSIF